MRAVFQANESGGCTGSAPKRAAIPMMRWFRAYLPKEERFFDLFDRHAQTVIQGAVALQGMLNGGEETPVYCQRVNQFENDADNITREVLTAVRRTFITPFV